MQYDSARAKFRNTGESPEEKLPSDAGGARGRRGAQSRPAEAPAPLCFPSGPVGTRAFISLFKSHTYDFIASHVT